jgi:PAS domain S-box-containing protein
MKHRAVRTNSEAASAGLRRRAESRLGKAAAPRRSDAESVRLLHELEVHQIELELQNAQLLEARNEVEAALSRYTDLYDFAPAGYFSIDEDGLILEVNLPGAAMVGVERSRLVHRKLERFLDPTSLPAYRALLTRVFERPQKQTCEVSLRGMDGAAVWTDFQAASADSLRGRRRWCRVAVTDISAVKRAEEAQARADALADRNRALSLEIAERQKAEKALKASEKRQIRLLGESRSLAKQLRQLSHGVLHAQEEERKRISRELHDVVAQSVLAINIHVEMLGREAAGTSAALRKRTAQTKRLLDELVEVVHRFSRELRPTMLDDLGLGPALQSFTKDFGRRTGVDVRLKYVDAAERLTNDRRTALYRVAQEALSNVAKHAHASRVDMIIREESGDVVMEIADDGKAFDVERARVVKRHRRLGLLGMKERVEMVDGRFSITSAPGKGTRVRARVPIFDRHGRRGAARP